MSGIGSEKARQYMLSLPYKPRVPLASLFPGQKPAGSLPAWRRLLADPWMTR